MYYHIRLWQENNQQTDMTETVSQREQRRLQEAVQCFLFDTLDQTTEKVQYYIERFENKLRISGVAIAMGITIDINKCKGCRCDLFLACIG